MAQCAERLACGAGLLALRPMPASARGGGAPDWDAFAGLPAGELGVSCGAGASAQAAGGQAAVQVGMVGWQRGRLVPRCRAALLQLAMHLLSRWASLLTRLFPCSSQCR